MRIEIEIPKDFESDYKGDMFKDFFSRILCDIKNGTLCGNYEKETAEMFLKAFDESRIAFDTEKVVEQLEEKTDFLKDCTKYGNKDVKQQEKSYFTMMMYEVADLVDDLMDIVKQAAAEYSNTIIDGKYCFQTCACTEKCDKCSRLCNGDIDWYENIDNWTEEHNNGWIPCSERIPTEQERWLGHDITDAEPREFIVMVKGAYEPTTGYYHSGYGCWVKDLTSEYDDKNTGYCNDIVAWRFFPEPYNPKGE